MLQGAPPQALQLSCHAVEQQEGDARALVLIWQHRKLPTVLEGERVAKLYTVSSEIYLMIAAQLMPFYPFWYCSLLFLYFHTFSINCNQVVLCLALPGRKTNCFTSW